MIQPAHPAYRPEIDGLRALAVLLVLGYHAFPELLPHGFIGVDIFFVISGFLITGILLGEFQQHQKINLGYFYARRLRRIAPALLLLLSTLLLFGWFGVFSPEYKILAQHITAGALYSENFLLWQNTGYFDLTAYQKPLLHLWSLGVEAQFYLLFPLLLWLALRWRKPLLFCTGGFLISLALFILAPPTDQFYLPHLRFWELCLGAMLACVTHSRAVPEMRSFTALIVVAALAAALALPFPASPVFAALGAAILLALPPQSWPHKILSHEKIIYIGRISYPLYLWHWPLLAFAQQMQLTKIGAITKIILLAISFLLAAFTHRYIENPSRKLNVLHFGLFLAALHLTIAGAAFWIDQRDGLPARSHLPQEIKLPGKYLIGLFRDDACEKKIRHIGADFLYCRLSDVGGHETVAILGDSHAHTVFYGLSKILAPHKINVILLGTGNCPPRIGAMVNEPEKDQKRCIDNNRRMFDYVIKDESITKIILAERGPLYITGKGFELEEEGFKINYIMPANGHDITDRAKFFRDNLEQTAAQLSEHAKIYYLLENPEMGFDALACFNANKDKAETVCRVPFASIQKRQDAYRELMRSIPNIEIIDPRPAFCPDEWCISIKDHELLYGDDDHLSETGSLFQAEEVLAPYFVSR